MPIMFGLSCFVNTGRFHDARLCHLSSNPGQGDFGGFLLRFQKSGFPGDPLFGRVHRTGKINDVGYFVGTVDTGCFQNFPSGLMVNGEWKRSQTLRTCQDDERFAVMVQAISRDLDKSIFSLMSCGPVRIWLAMISRRLAALT
jgi:hypothetical protein